jgi:transcriptional regulator with XRE-family HTH domain
MEISRYPNKLKLFRRCNGYSQKNVACILGLADTSSLSRWEKGTSLPSMTQVFQLARIYKTMPHELFIELWNQYDRERNLLAQDDEPFNTNQSFLL